MDSRCRDGGAGAGGDVLQRRAVAGSSENRDYVIPVAISTRVWSGRRRVRRGTRLRGSDEVLVAGEGERRRGMVAELR
jgi:hypothetical protein